MGTSSCSINTCSFVDNGCRLEFSAQNINNVITRATRTSCKRFNKKDK